MVKILSVSQRAISPGGTSQGVGILYNSFIKTITITNRGLVKELAPLSSCLISGRFLFSLWESRRKSRHYWTRLLLCNYHNETKYADHWALVGAKMIITIQHKLLSVMLNQSNYQHVLKRFGLCCNSLKLIRNIDPRKNGPNIFGCCGTYILCANFLS